jgi:HD-GYP domain-containing protein (c-di-GMP phosphodiesterase class II)
MNKVALNELKTGLFFSKPLFLDEGFVLLVPELAVEDALVKRLVRWEFRELLTDGAVLSSPGGEDHKASAAAAEVVEGAADQEHLDKFVSFYAEYTTYVEALYTNFVTKTEIDYPTLVERIKGLGAVLAEDRRHLLRAQSVAIPNKNYLVSHAVRSSVFAMILGMAMKLPNFRLIELGSATVLHEIGMVKLPPQIYMAGRPLSPQERKSITAHPILGYNLLKDKQIPLAVCLGSLEHHERMNGSGYPRAVTGDKISLYSRIIMVACSYDAVTSDRPYKEGKDGYSGMVDIIKNEGKQYDDTVIRALV